MDNVLLANSVMFIIFNILLSLITCSKVSKVQTNLMEHTCPRVQRNFSLRRDIVSSGTKSCTENNDFGANISEIKEIAVKMLEKVNELEKLNNMTMSTSTTLLSSALTKEHTHTPSSVTSTLPLSLPATSTLPLPLPATSTTAKSTPTKSEPVTSPDRKSGSTFSVTTSQSVGGATSAAKTERLESLTTPGGTIQMNCMSLPLEYEKQTHLRTMESAADGIRVRMWGPWTAWTCCSVTCGKGRQVRWRHCIADKCPVADAEMEEKICQKPACPSSKFLGLF